MSKFHAIYNKGGVSPEPGGNTYGEVQTLLWTNPNTKVDFNTKKIELDLSLYNGIIVEYYNETTSSVQTIISRVKYEKNISHSLGAGFVNESNTGLARNITAIDDSGITFGNGFGPSELNSFVIPYKIYGYKQYEAGNLSVDADEIILNANTDTQLDVKSYYLTLGVAMSTDLSFNKGTLIGYIRKEHAGANDIAAIVYTGDDGIINTPLNSLPIKKIEVG